MLCIFLLLAVCTLLLIKLIPAQGPKRVSYSDFLAELRSDHLTDVQITERELIGVRKDAPVHSASVRERSIIATRLPGVDESQLLKELEAHPVKFGGHIDAIPWLWTALGWMLPLLLLGFLYAGMRRMSPTGGPLTFGKNKAQIYDQSSRLKVNFDDVAGVDEAKLDLRTSDNAVPAIAAGLRRAKLQRANRRDHRQRIPTHPGRDIPARKADPVRAP